MYVLAYIAETRRYACRHDDDDDDDSFNGATLTACLNTQHATLTRQPQSKDPSSHASHATRDTQHVNHQPNMQCTACRSTHALFQALTPPLQNTYMCILHLASPHARPHAKGSQNDEQASSNGQTSLVLLFAAREIVLLLLFLFLFVALEGGRRLT